MSKSVGSGVEWEHLCTNVSTRMLSEIHEVGWSVEVQLRYHIFNKCEEIQDVVLYFTLHVPQFTLCLPLVPAGHLKETMKACRNLGDTSPFCKHVLVNFVRTWRPVLSKYSLPVLLLLAQA